MSCILCQRSTQHEYELIKCSTCLCTLCTDCVTSGNCIFCESYNDPLDRVLEATDRIGLPNLTNSCYVNVIVQIFLHSDILWPVFRTLFGQHEHMLKSIRQQYCKANNIGETDQCDAVLFCSWIMDKIVEENPEFKMLFSHSLQVRYVCSNDHVTDLIQTQNIYIVYPDDNSTGLTDEYDLEYDQDMTQCIAQQSKDTVEKLCVQCNRVCLHDYLFGIYDLTFNLFFNLQQFEDKSVYIYETITLFLPAKNQAMEYTLKGFVVHKGTNRAGHYVIYIRENDNTWSLYNDRKITLVEDIDIVLKIKKQGETIPLLWYVADSDY